MTYFLVVAHYKAVSGHNIMEEFSKNPGLVHIGEDILSLLDKKTALDCRLVNKSWNSILNAPKFWLMKLMREEKDCENTIRSW